MTVNVHDLDKYTRQTVETWSSTAKHDLGFRVLDRSTGKTYRYVKHMGSVAGVSGGPAGLWGAGSSTDGIASMNYVCADASQAESTKVVGVYRGSATSAASIYGFIEEVNICLPTTILSCYAAAIDVGDALTWSEDGFLSSCTQAVALSVDSLLRSVQGFAVDSHAASKNQSAVAVTTITPLTVKWI